MLATIELQRQSCSDDQVWPASSDTSEADGRSVEEEPLYRNADNVFSTLASEPDLNMDWIGLDYFLNVDFSSFENSIF